MLSPVVEDIRDRVPNLRRRLQLRRVIAIRERAASPPHQGVQPPCRGDGEAAHPARQRVLVVGFDDEVQVRALDRYVTDPEVIALQLGRQRGVDRAIARASTQTLELPHHADDDVHRMTADQGGARKVRLLGAFRIEPRVDARAAGAGARAAVGGAGDRLGQSLG